MAERHVFQRGQGISLLLARGMQDFRLAILDLRQDALREILHGLHVDPPGRVVGDAHVHQTRLQDLPGFIGEGQREDVFGRQTPGKRLSDTQGQGRRLRGPRIGDDQARPAPRCLDFSLFFGWGESCGEELSGRRSGGHRGGKTGGRREPLGSAAAPV
ncbi:hypothetical protein D3C87_1601160 [compost metagenome]